MKPQSDIGLGANIRWAAPYALLIACLMSAYVIIKHMNGGAFAFEQGELSLPDIVFGYFVAAVPATLILATLRRYLKSQLTYCVTGILIALPFPSVTLFLKKTPLAWDQIDLIVLLFFPIWWGAVGGTVVWVFRQHIRAFRSGLG